MPVERRKQVTEDRLDLGKIPPQAIELETSVLGGLMGIKNLIIELLPVLKVEVFYKTEHQLICQAILNLVEKESPIDIMTVCLELQRMHKLEDVGGAYYVSTLTDFMPLDSQVHFRYRILMEMYFRRKLIELSYVTTVKAHDVGDDVFDLYDWLGLQLEEIEIHAGAGSTLTSTNVHDMTLDIIDNKEKTARFFPIGDPGIDDILAISPGNLVNFSGKSGSGKTSLIIHLARMLLEKYHTEVSFCWYTMEDEPQKVMMNFISPRALLTHSQMMGKGYTLSDYEKRVVQDNAKMFKRYDIEFVHQPSFMNHIKVHFQRFCSQRPGKFCIAIIDNLMLLRDNHHQRFKSKSYEIDDHIAGQLQSTFTSTKKDSLVNIWYVHHLTKEQLSKTNANEGYRPTEDNIRGSTRLRDIATQGILINRPGEFPDLVKQYRKTKIEEPIKKLMVSEVYKNRNGQTGFIRHFVDLGFKVFYPF